MSSTEGIPIRRLVVHDPKDMPLHFGETPGGSIFSTTPGGTRIYYDRAFLLSRRDSPMTRSPPHLPYIPEVTLIPEPEKNGEVVENGVTTGKKEKSESSTDKTNLSTSEQQQTTKAVKKDGDDQFSMDM
ncbi:unnamed protein product [Rotaria socialis]|uniref:Eukaryotic translation initiation factor 4E binding protein n=1 Tax=Rotaria socialis TaxID=392032 RepID=A0A820F160_9BILA|nr:unnamed protein product [Rotaria socialis]CAF3334142.1 unnamed protein product [Rotaria socialis]CAF3345612.1 unnamed protein product [Rotaria socialis]CAF3541168.1 unnamed protein product [Rotaria socialis]CAF4254178.1 unnamed protein product [Rotaria socialis]